MGQEPFEFRVVEAEPNEKFIRGEINENVLKFFEINDI